MGDDRPNRYEEDGKIIYRASSLGNCIKSLVALGLGHTPDPHPDWLQKKFDQGNAGESVVIDMLRPNWRIMDEVEGHQFTWHDSQILVEIPVGTRVVIRGHADGVGTCYKAVIPEHGESEWKTGERRLIEVKCVTEDYAQRLLKELPFYYTVQVVVYSHGVSAPAMMVLGVKDQDGKVQYILSQNLEPKITIRDVKMRVVEIEGWIERGELPTCDHPNWPCQFRWMCDEVRKGLPGTKDWEVEEKLQESIDLVKARVRVHGEGTD